ncbi:MAG: hypothetical protein ACRC0I_09835 [Sediminibacterium sp.]|nr:hypothetical protein [Chitinophagaceae bacterium]MCA6447917.1 hypothetical protein [Chitinophagaceae bacterium]
MKKCLPVILLLIFWGCTEKKIDFSGDVPVKEKDFIAAFRPITLPFSLMDTGINSAADSISIGIKVFEQFIPDSAFTTILGKNRKVTIKPVGKIKKEKENYLLTLVITKSESKLVVFVLDAKNKFLGVKELMSSKDREDGYQHAVSINKEPTFILIKEKTIKETNLFTRTGWVYNNAGFFMVVITDSNEDPQKQQIINPIDTLPRKNKRSGDYVKDKKSYVSLRDGKDPNSYIFFIHFEKNEGACIGELKGNMKMKSATAGIYTANADPCIIDFNFEGSAVTVKEQGSCGNHRGIKCFFNDSFQKKREPKQKATKK